jgi:phosphohistidine phosphatase SixA
MTLYLVRHGKAGNRGAWDGEDALRPLTAKGREQAEAIAARLGGQAITRVISSPHLRCVQTVEPLAAHFDLNVETCDALTEGAAFEAALDLITEVPDHSVLCSHGDVIVDVIAAYERRGADIGADRHWGKGAIWFLERHGANVVRARSIATPERLRLSQ